MIANNGAAPEILKNVVGEGHHWLGLTLQGVDLQPRRDRGADHLVVRRPDPHAAQDLRRQLPVVARPPRGARHRHRDEDRLGRDRLAAAERPRRAPDQRAPRPLRQGRRGQGDPVRAPTEPSDVGAHRPSRCDRPCGTTSVRRSTPGRSACSCRRTGPCWPRFGLAGYLHDPGWLVLGAGVELGYLLLLGTNARFQRFVAGKLSAGGSSDAERKLAALIAIAARRRQAPLRRRWRSAARRSSSSSSTATPTAPGYALAERQPRPSSPGCTCGCW